MNQTKQKFESLRESASGSFVFEFEKIPNVLESFRRFSRLDKCLLLESSKSATAFNGKQLGRYSFLTAEPFDWLQFPVDSKSGFEEIRRRLRRYSAPTWEDLPPFQGGLAGLLSYDLNRSLESIPAARHRDFEMPSMALGCYDIVLAWDHKSERAFLISQGFPESESAKRRKLAQQRIARFLQILDSPIEAPPPPLSALPRDRLAPTCDVRGPTGLYSNFSKADYQRAVEKAIEFVHAGDVFQVNLAQRLLYRANGHASELYERLRDRNPAPFSGYFDLGSTQVVSASPERLISLRKGMVESRPIKGTRKRTRFPEVDLNAQFELKNSVKDKAENTMIVDLMRNDLSRVCEDDSVHVTQLCELETYESVLHLVSAVQGKMRNDCDVVDLIRAVFPGGSITGAPKIRAMEIIAELEPTARGAYCGSLGYFGFNATSDFNILIRSITASQGWWQIPVGGGIVSQSDPAEEYEETWTKAAGMLRALAP